MAKAKVGGKQRYLKAALRADKDVSASKPSAPSAGPAPPKHLQRKIAQKHTGILSGASRRTCSQAPEGWGAEAAKEGAEQQQGAGQLELPVHSFGSNASIPATGVPAAIWSGCEEQQDAPQPGRQRNTAHAGRDQPPCVCRQPLHCHLPAPADHTAACVSRSHTQSQSWQTAVQGQAYPCQAELSIPT
ncbi:hypothetical protein HaLaN_14090 [Haematococcus lacustris]|uniref:Uncharacterized protein n=1 Tax=Haematococcus lacustris TaxID=44745 RepID=A0A699Z5S7_HAELA|nr:hypothetical protein HaLaN_14090 [Haematococcus lacustris]